MRKNALRVLVSYKHKTRAPLRTLAEMAEEFGISVFALGQLLAKHDGPKAALDNRSSRNRTSWYNPDEMRKWWAGRLDTVNKVNDNINS